MATKPDTNPEVLEGKDLPDQNMGAPEMQALMARIAELEQKVKVSTIQPAEEGGHALGPGSDNQTEKWLDEYVDVKLFKDNERYKGDVYVSVNSENCQIKRGEWVRIKRKFALILDQSEIQDQKTAELCDAKEQEFSAGVRARNL